MAPESTPQETFSSELSAPFTRKLDNAGVERYRSNYRRFRVGKAKGAKGERPEMEAIPKSPSADVAPEDEIFEFEQENDRLYKQIHEFRDQYRRYRMGFPHGAKGDVSSLTSRLTTAHAHMVPVAQLSAFLAQVDAARFATPGTDSTFHIHIGAGRLGMGLVVPAICRSKVPFALLQKPFPEFDPVVNNPDKKVALYVNGEPLNKELVVVTDLTTLPPSTPHEKPNLLVISEDPLLLHLLFSTATSFSMSLGPFMKDMVPVFEKNLPIAPPNGKKPALYAAENDHKAVHEFAKKVENRLEVIDCMVDRICPDRKVEADRILSQAEPFEGEMVVMHGAQNGLNPPFKGEHIMQPKIEAEANYFTRRKFLLVNGTHTTLAFMTLCLKQKDKSSPAGEYQLVDWRPETCGEEYHKQIWAWAVARLCILLWEHELDVIHHAHGTKSEDELVDVLLAYATRTLNRFASIKDTTSRVLSGGVANRWEGRLNEVNNFLDSFKATSIANQLMKKAKVQLSYMKQVVKELCEESYPFTGLNVKSGKVVVT